MVVAVVAVVVVVVSAISRSLIFWSRMSRDDLTLPLTMLKSEMLKAVLADVHVAALQRAVVVPVGKQVPPSIAGISFMENAEAARGKIIGYPLEFPPSVVLFPR